MRNGYLIFAIVFVFVRMASGQEKIPEIVLEDLKNPCGVAIQPGTRNVFISDSGNGRVIEIFEKKARDVIVDFPVSSFELDGNLAFGPLGIIFRGRDTLIVGGGGSDDGEDLIGVFDLGERGDDPLSADDSTIRLKLEADSNNAAEGDFFSFVLTRRQLFVTCGGDNKKGWIAVADLEDDEIKNLRRQIPSSELAKVAAPGGLAISPEGHVVVGQMGTRDTPGDSVLAFFSTAGELLDKFPTGLNDIVALEYGPGKKRLFALDFSWEDPSKGGLYQLVAVDSVAGCKARLIAQLDRPTAMAFDHKGNLYVTTCGLPTETSEELEGEDQILPDPGKVVLIKKP